ncbi:MAG: molecular chaperone [Gammaproteobacteria bacterium]|nr:molecular chaperone [Gammaproteobacteria bacterium]MBT6550998.1 molecular chaperone [Gammaproteobacteria bacterium]
MTLQVQTHTPVYEEHFTPETKKSGESLCLIDVEQEYRASAYSLIAALLRASPDEDLLNQLTGFTQDTQGDGDVLMVSMSMLGLSAKMHTATAIEDEFHDLFIGLGKGELVPYGSWYLTGFLMEKPLSDLRDDLNKLGFERSDSVTEPEDHAAALCEVISLMISNGTELSIQKDFFLTHMECWMDKFFSDLANAESAIFYKALGRFGSAFIEFENEYFSMQT